MKNYYRIFLGKGSMHAEECFNGKYVGTDFDLHQDLTDQFPENWRYFNRKFIPILIEDNPGKTRVAAGLACGSIWMVSKGMEIGDIVLSPDGEKRYRVGKISGPYYYEPEGPLQHRRPVDWSDQYIDRDTMSEKFRKSTGASGTVVDIAKYSEEIETLIGELKPPVLISNDESIEDPTSFAMESHLEEFLIKNWSLTDLGKHYEIYEVDGELVGRQFQTDTGPMDILAISKDKKTLLVVELKKGRASDAVVGQLLRYMGYVKNELLEEHQTVKGIIIALNDDQRLRRALTLLEGTVDFYRYDIKFELLND